MRQRAVGSEVEERQEPDYRGLDFMEVGERRAESWSE